MGIFNKMKSIIKISFAIALFLYGEAEALRLT